MRSAWKQQRESVSASRWKALREKRLVRKVRKIKMNVSSNQPYRSICCIRDTTYPTGARCYWNASLFTVPNIFPKLIIPSETTIAELRAMIPGRRTPCSNDAVCYSDSSSEDISTCLFGNATASIGDSFYGDLTCRLDGKEYCFETPAFVGMENILPTCQAFFDFETSKTYYREESFKNILLMAAPTVVTLVLLLATIVVYTIVPELKNLHGLILRTYLLCCFGDRVAAVLCAIVVIVGINNFTTIFWHYTYLSSFSWLNVLAFDIWWTFRSLRYFARQSPRKKYMVYSIYGWGFPMLSFGAGLLIEFLPNTPDGLIKPIHDGFWLFGENIVAAYLGIPMSITMVIDVFFVVLTVISISGQKKAISETLDVADSRRFNDEKSRFYLYVKLLILMGLTKLDHARGMVTPVEVPRIVSFILGLPNLLEGPIFFILCVCNARTKRLLSKHLKSRQKGTVIQWIQRAIARIRALVRRPRVS